MTHPRRSQRQLDEAMKVIRLEEMQRDIAEGRLVVRAMTPRERDQSDARWAAAAPRRARSRKRRSHA